MNLKESMDEHKCRLRKEEAVRILKRSGNKELSEYADFISKEEIANDPIYLFRIARKVLHGDAYDKGERLLAERGSAYLRAITAYATRNEYLLERFSEDLYPFVIFCTVKNSRIKNRQDLLESAVIPKGSSYNEKRTRVEATKNLRNKELLLRLAEEDPDDLVRYHATKRLRKLGVKYTPSEKPREAAKV